MPFIAQRMIEQQSQTSNKKVDGAIIFHKKGKVCISGIMLVSYV